jgi:hypothetical protein
LVAVPTSGHHEHSSAFQRRENDGPVIQVPQGRLNDDRRGLFKRSGLGLWPRALDIEMLGLFSVCSFGTMPGVPTQQLRILRRAEGKRVIFISFSRPPSYYEGLIIAPGRLENN